ncbi:nucleotide exchange factor GrpE [Streptomyces zagrosensis]|uniref:Molecular chaperone GrpE n=1 Tax=Streptomyces zagrosensis TaxID=1042984 RepID=A0A7W9QC52_9ACTN|nr:nucleotide exchange factor GrpE [Streptomyces zagrosensis]MBB5937209.1 molecular chaperone GrpE [Streptomyces zagrosensis]
MTEPAPAAATGPPSELDKLRRRVEALSRKRDEAEARLRDLLTALLPLDDVLTDTSRRAGALHEVRSPRESVSAAIALSEQADAAHRMLRRELAQHDVIPVDVVGRVVDPAEMCVVGTEPHPTWPEGTVLGEKLTGFRLGGAVLRAPRVVIAVPGQAPEPEPESSVTIAASGSRRAQPQRTTRSQRRGLPRKPSAGHGRRSRRT